MENSTEHFNEACHLENTISVRSITVLVYCIAVLLSLVGNILVLVSIGLYETLRSLTNVLILNLALSDLMFTIGLPFFVSFEIWGIWSEAECRVNFFFNVGFYSSIIFLLIMTVQCLITVVQPGSGKMVKPGRRFFLVTFAWVMSILAALPDTLSIKATPLLHEPGQFECYYSSHSVMLAVIYGEIVFFAIAFLTMSFCCIKILLILKSTTNISTRSIRLKFSITAIFFITWAPYFTVLLIDLLSTLTTCDHSIRLQYAFFFSSLLMHSHCCLNPLLYFTLDEKFRDHLKTILRKMFQRKTNTDFQQMPIVEIHSDTSM